MTPVGRFLATLIVSINLGVPWTDSSNAVAGSAPTSGVATSRHQAHIDVATLGSVFRMAVSGRRDRSASPSPDTAREVAVLAPPAPRAAELFIHRFPQPPVSLDVPAGRAPPR